jgi:hypothetical protein
MLPAGSIQPGLPVLEWPRRALPASVLHAEPVRRDGIHGGRGLVGSAAPPGMKITVGVLSP